VRCNNAKVQEVVNSSNVAANRLEVGIVVTGVGIAVYMTAAVTIAVAVAGQCWVTVH
jgi:hypothetical protein